MTNGEKIRRMTDEELADFLAPAETESLVPGFCEELCFKQYQREYDGLKPVCHDSFRCRFEADPGETASDRNRRAWLWWLGLEGSVADGSG